MNTITTNTPELAMLGIIQVRYLTSSSSKLYTMITIESSHGIITTDDKGIVIEKNLHETDCYLGNAVRFDLEEWDNWYERYTEKPSPKPSEFDVLELGFWNADGTYNPPSTEWRNNIYNNH